MHAELKPLIGWKVVRVRAEIAGRKDIKTRAVVSGVAAERRMITCREMI